MSYGSSRDKCLVDSASLTVIMAQQLQMGQGLGDCSSVAAAAAAAASC